MLPFLDANSGKDFRKKVNSWRSIRLAFVFIFHDGFFETNINFHTFVWFYFSCSKSLKIFILQYLIFVYFKRPSTKQWNDQEVEPIHSWVEQDPLKVANTQLKIHFWGHNLSYLLYLEVIGIRMVLTSLCPRLIGGFDKLASWMAKPSRLRIQRYSSSA